jgi:hypothetical protein
MKNKEEKEEVALWILAQRECIKGTTKHENKLMMPLENRKPK